MVWTWPRTVIVLAFEIVALCFATIVSIASDTEPRSVPWTLAYTSNTGCTL